MYIIMTKEVNIERTYHLCSTLFVQPHSPRDLLDHILICKVISRSSKKRTSAIVPVFCYQIFNFCLMYNNIKVLSLDLILIIIIF